MASYGVSTLEIHMDMFKRVNELLAENAIQHVREGNTEKANEYIRQMRDMLDSAVNHIDALTTTITNMEKSYDR